MTLRRTTRTAAGVVVSLLCLAACTGNAASDSSTAATTPGSGTASGSAAASGTTAAAAGTNQLTSVPGLDPSALVVMNKPPYANGQWAIAVSDMDSGEKIISLNADVLVVPGSVVKTYSVGAAWQQFGPDSTIVTPVKPRCVN